MAMNTVDVEVERLLEAGKSAAREGNADLARSFLTQVVERDPHNEQAWMWLSGVVSEPEEQQICLENVLVINPYNDKARKGLEYLSTKTGMPVAVPPMPPKRTAPLPSLNFDQMAPYAAAPQPQPQPQPQANDAQPFMMPDFSAMQAQFAPADGLPSDPWKGSGNGNGNGIGNGNGNGIGNGIGHSNASDGAPLDSTPTYSADSLNIDWSRGMHLDPAPGSPEYDAPAAPATQWPGMEMFPQAGMPGGNSFPGAEASWAMQPGPGFEPLQTGSLNLMGNAPAAGNGGSYDAGQQPMDWQNMAGLVDTSGLMEPSIDFQLPNPADLPGYALDAASGANAKPWYAQSTQLDASMLSHAGGHADMAPGSLDEMTTHLSMAAEKPAVMVDCPNCAEKVADTALSCPRCNFTFFVNCPHCHELIDTIDAKPDSPEPCPYCGNTIDKMQLGRSSTDPTIAYASERPSKPDGITPEMKHYVDEATRPRRNLTWAWAVDVMWLVAVVVMVWALTQVPTWFHIVGQY